MNSQNCAQLPGDRPRWQQQQSVLLSQFLLSYSFPHHHCHHRPFSSITIEWQSALKRVKFVCVCCQEQRQLPACRFFHYHDVQTIMTTGHRRLLSPCSLLVGCVWLLSRRETKKERKQHSKLSSKEALPFFPSILLLLLLFPSWPHPGSSLFLTSQNSRRGSAVLFLCFSPTLTICFSSLNGWPKLWNSKQPATLYLFLSS